MNEASDFAKQNVNDNDLWKTFRDALGIAIQNVQEPYFKVQRYDAEPAWRERAYCYELYHQLRAQLPESSPFIIHGEIDKAGHENITRHFRKKRPNPDFILHIPGNQGIEANLTVIEVKYSAATIKEIKKDLKKLRVFLKKIQYQHAIMLFFGDEKPPRLFKLGKIEAIWHNKVGSRPIVSTKGKFILSPSCPKK